MSKFTFEQTHEQFVIALNSNGNKGNENRCVCCGEVIPEGTQYCYTCGKKAEKGENDDEVSIQNSDNTEN